MNNFYSDRAYISLIKDLESIKSFYTKIYGDPDVFGKITYPLPHLNKATIQEVFSKLNEIELTISIEYKDSFENFKSQVRTKILSIISNIPKENAAIEIYLNNYELYLSSCEKVAELFPEALYEIYYEIPYGQTEPVEVSTKSKYDLYDEWKSGKPIPDIVNYEKLLSLICHYFNSNRSIIYSPKIYTGYNVREIIGYRKLAGLLMDQGYIEQHHILAFSNLLSGREYFEPIDWKGSTADLNKLISSIYKVKTNNAEEESKNIIEWSKFCKFFLVDGNFIESSQLRTASISKENGKRSLKPFQTLVEQAEIK